MLKIQSVLNQILEELEVTLSKIANEPAEELIDTMLQAKKIFVTGAGRSGFAVKAFAMRLMHLGFSVYVVGETITPNLVSEDMLLIASGSGATEGQVVLAKKAKSLGSTLGVITIDKTSPIGELADVLLEIPAPSPKLQKNVGSVSSQPMGALFEQSLFLTLDALILLLMEKTAKNSDLMFQNHANLE